MRNAKQGSITISRTDSNMHDSVVRIVLRDETGSRTLFQVELTMEQFGTVLSGLSYVPCKYSEPAPRPTAQAEAVRDE